MQVHALNAPDSVLRLEEWQAGSHRIAVAILNNEKTLNALSLPMVEILAPQLTRWAADPEVAMLWLGGAGDRALAAGGDIQALYAAIARNHAAGQQIDDYAERFFEAEYRLDFQLHTFPKPVLGWGHGVVMGGGLGLLSAASHRVVTERARIAMPEVTIGLFPDAGATWLLRNAEPAWAAWLGLSGAHMNQADAVALRLGQYPLPSSTREAVQQELCAVSWSAEPEATAARLDTLLRRSVATAQVRRSALHGVSPTHYSRDPARQRAAAATYPTAPHSPLVRHSKTPRKVPVAPFHVCSKAVGTGPAAMPQHPPDSCVHHSAPATLPRPVRHCAAARLHRHLETARW